MLMQDDHNDNIKHWCSMTVQDTKHIHHNLTYTSQLETTTMTAWIRSMCMCTSQWQGPYVCYLEEVGPHLPQGENLIEEKIVQWRKDPMHSAIKSSDCTPAICIALVKVELCGNGTQHNTRHGKKQRAQSLRLTFILTLSFFLYTLCHVAPRWAPQCHQSPVILQLYIWQDFLSNSFHSTNRNGISCLHAHAR